MGVAVAALNERDGVLVLSRNAGAADTMTDAVFVNPFDVKTGFKSKLDASIHTFFVVLSFVLSKVMRRGHKIQKRQGYIRLHSRLKPFVLIPPFIVVIGECTLLALGVWIESPSFSLNDAVKCILGLEEVLLIIILEKKI